MTIKWIAGSKHYVEVDGEVYVHIDDVLDELKKIRESLIAEKKRD